MHKEGLTLLFSNALLLCLPQFLVVESRIQPSLVCPLSCIVDVSALFLIGP